LFEDGKSTPIFGLLAKNFGQESLLASPIIVEDSQYAHFTIFLDPNYFPNDDAGKELEILASVKVIDFCF
jgi:hypothetical protein